MKRWTVVLLGVMIAALSVGLAAQTEVAKDPPKQFTDASLERYWSCMERNDLESIKELLWQHKNVERIDASIFGLPADDFDDDSLLTVEERLWYRAERIKADNPLPEHGPIIYPHHLRETLDHLYIVKGQRPNCSHVLESLDLDGALVAETLGSGWSNDKDINTDTSNARGEVHVTVDRQNEARVFISSVQSQTSGETSMSSWRSTDWGANFTKGNIGNNSGSTWECDPCGYYQRSVNPSKLYESKIGCNTGSCTQTYVMMRVSSDNGASFADCVRPTTATNSDRQMHVVDNTPTSPCYGNIYLTWHDGNTEKVVTSTAAQSCTAWGSVTSLSAASSAITPDVATGPDGRVYVTWGNFGDSTFKIRGSNDCGVTWNAPAATTVKAYNGAWKNNIPAQCVRGVSTHPQVDVDRCAWSAYKGTVYVVMQDYSTTGTDLGCSPAYTNTLNYDLFFSKSTNNGTTWSTPVNITAGEGSTVDDFHFMMRVDEMDGAIYIGWMRSRLNPTSLADRQTTSYVMMRSIDGGTTWSNVYTVSSQEGNERLSGMSSFERGDYESIDVYDGVVWPAWIDRRGASSTSPEHVITRKICTEPTHKSERAPTFATPPTTVTPGASRLMTITWTAPDALWGDANENNAARKYQLYVDNVLTTDNISWTSTSTTWTAPDCSSSHTFRIRAINQCGVYKDYATATSTATGCCTNNPSNVVINPAGPVTLCQGTAQSLSLTLTGGVGPFTYQWTQDGADIGGATSSTYSANTTGTHAYNCRVTGSGCSSGAAANASTQITWQAVPTFSGVTSVTNPASATCTLNLTWSSASTPCAGPVTYKVYRSTSTPVVTDVAHLVAFGLSGTSYSDTTGLVSGTTYYYRAHAYDASTGQEDGNSTELSGVPTGPVATSTLTDTFEGSLSGGGFDLAGWTHSAIGGTTNWAWSTAQFHDGTHSWFAQDIATTSDMVLVSPSFGVGTSTTLSFWHTYAFEGSTSTCYDAATLEYSTNGTTWTVLPAADFTAGGYTGTVNTGFSNPIGGKAGWCAGTVGAMTQVTANLGGDSNLVNKTVQLRWHEGNDSSTAATGWYVDTVTIANAQIMGTCATGTGCTAPGAPTLSSATGACGGVNLSWTAGSGTTSSYNVYRSTNTSCPVGALTKLTGPIVATSYSDTSAVAGTTYTYVVRGACDAGGTVESVNSNCLAGTRLVSPTPTITGNSSNTCPATTVVLSTASGKSGYQWYNGGSPIGGANTYQYTVTTTGSYTVSYTDTNGCSGTSAAKAMTINACIPNIVYLSRGAFTAVDTNGNATMEAGEKWSVQVTLQNTGNTDAANVTASLSAMAAGDGITVCNNPGSFGTIVAGGTASYTYTFIVNPAKWYGTYACGSSLTFNVVSKSTTTPGCTCANETVVFSNAVGIASGNQTATQVTSPLTAKSTTSSSSLSPAFTLASADTATLSYTSAYTPKSGTTTLFGPDDMTNIGSWTATGSAGQNAGTAHCSPHSNSVARLPGATGGGTSITLTNAVSTVGLTNIQVTFDYYLNNNGSSTACRLDWSTNNGSTWTMGAFSGTSTSWVCSNTVTLPTGAAGVSQLKIRFVNPGTSTTRYAYVDYVTITGSSAGTGTWTANAQVSLVDPSNTATILKAYGAADAQPYNVKALYTGPGTYQIRLSENNGGTASLTSGSMNATLGGTCGTWTASCVALPKKVPFSVTPTMIKKNDASAGNVAVSFDNTNCASSNYHIIYGWGENLPAWTVSGNGGCSVTPSSSATNWSGMPATTGHSFLWFLVVGDNGGTTEGSWGLTSSGSERGGTSASNQCSCTTKDTSSSCGTP